MLDSINIKDYFMLLSSTESSECEKYLPVIKNSTDYVLSILKEGAIKDENISRIEGLCGAVAYYKYALMEFGKCDDRVNLESMSFSGDVMKKIKSAKMLQDEHFKSCSDLINNKTVIFKKVNVYV